MADLAQLERALRNADAAGDEAAARTLAAAIRDQRKSNPLGDFTAGLVRGAGSIGATLLSPIDAAARAVGVENSFIGRRDRRQAMDDALRGMGADTDSLAFSGGKLASEVAGTLGVGGALAKPIQAAVPMLTQAAPRVGEAVGRLGKAIGSSGFTVGQTGGRAADLALRTAGGAASGGAAAALVDPNDAAAGAAIGGALPGVLKTAGAAGSAVGSVFKGKEKKAAEELARALNLGNPDDINRAVQKLRAAQELVQGSQPTVAQALQSPQAGVLQRVVSDSAGGAALRDALAVQNAARMAALEGVAPTVPTGIATARDDLGRSIIKAAQAGDSAAKQKTRDLFNQVPLDDASIYLPLDRISGAQSKYFGAGSFGDRSSVDEAVKTALALGQQSAPPIAPGAMAIPKLTTLREVQNYRSALGAEARKAAQAGDDKTAAALGEMRQAIDDRIDEVVRGDGGMDENLPIDWANKLSDALKAKRDQAAQFRTGPQAELFRRARDGAPTVQGGEAAGLFWGSSRPGLADDVDSFKRLIGDNPRLLGQFRSMVTTEGASTATAGGNLSSKFVRWVENTLPGLKKTFEPEQVRTLERIAQDIKRAESAAGAGMSRGSNTYQNAANALSLGLLDSPMVNMAANRIPFVGQFTGPILEGMRNTARTSKAQRMAGLLSDSSAAADSFGGLLSPPGRVAGLLDVTGDLTLPWLYRAAPVLSTSP